MRACAQMERDCLSGVVNVVKTIGAVPWELTDVGFQVLCMDEDG